MGKNKNTFKKQYGEWGCVAGAAEGIGKAFSNALADLGMNLILVDIKEKELELCREEIEKKGVEVITLHEDLSEKIATGSLMMSIKEVSCRLLIYNAAYGPVKPFLFNTEEELDTYIDLNSRTPLHLTYQLCEYLVESKQSGGIILMSSLAGLFGTNLVTPYGATKAFDFNLAEGLYHEMKRVNIDIMACAAGATNTPNYVGTKPKYSGIKPSIMEPQQVANEALDHLGRTGLFIPGRKNRMTFWLLTRILSRKTASRLMNDTMQKMYAHHFK